MRPSARPLACTSAPRHSSHATSDPPHRLHSNRRPDSNRGSTTGCPASRHAFLRSAARRPSHSAIHTRDTSTPRSCRPELSVRLSVYLTDHVRASDRFCVGAQEAHGRCNVQYITHLRPYIQFNKQDVLGEGRNRGRGKQQKSAPLGIGIGYT